jgi:NTE family protein
MIFKKEYKLGIALGGGSAKGLAHIGVLKVLNEEGIKIHSISGTSIGSIVGGIYALKPEIENLLSESKRLINSNAFKELRFDKFSRNEGGWFGRIKSRFRDGLTIADALMKKSLIPEETFEKDNEVEYIWFYL